MVRGWGHAVGRSLPSLKGICFTFSCVSSRHGRVPSWDLRVGPGGGASRSPATNEVQQSLPKPACHASHESAEESYRKRGPRQRLPCWDAAEPLHTSLGVVH